MGRIAKSLILLALAPGCSGVRGWQPASVPASVSLHACPSLVVPWATVSQARGLRRRRRPGCLRQDQAFFARQSRRRSRNAAGAQFEVTRAQARHSRHVESSASASTSPRAGCVLRPRGASVSREKDGGRTIMAATVQGEDTQHVRQDGCPRPTGALRLGENHLAS